MRAPSDSVRTRVGGVFLLIVAVLVVVQPLRRAGAAALCPAVEAFAPAVADVRAVTSPPSVRVEQGGAAVFYGIPFGVPLVVPAMLLVAWRPRLRLVGILAVFGLVTGALALAAFLLGVQGVPAGFVTQRFVEGYLVRPGGAALALWLALWPPANAQAAPPRPEHADPLM